MAFEYCYGGRLSAERRPRRGGARDEHAAVRGEGRVADVAGGEHAPGGRRGDGRRTAGYAGERHFRELFSEQRGTGRPRFGAGAVPEPDGPQEVPPELAVGPFFGDARRRPAHFPVSRRSRQVGRPRLELREPRQVALRPLRRLRRHRRPRPHRRAPAASVSRLFVAVFQKKRLLRRVAREMRGPRLRRRGRTRRRRRRRLLPRRLQPHVALLRNRLLLPLSVLLLGRRRRRQRWFSFSEEKPHASSSTASLRGAVGLPNLRGVAQGRRDEARRSTRPQVRRQRRPRPRRPPRAPLRLHALPGPPETARPTNALPPPPPQHQLTHLSRGGLLSLFLLPLSLVLPFLRPPSPRDRHPPVFALRCLPVPSFFARCFVAVESTAAKHHHQRAALFLLASSSVFFVNEHRRRRPAVFSCLFLLAC
mmetsp:Transcript_19753/g.61149  ORF Transcript_19753/g.61149 Transcript_19753/m.61149 type:complete len:421 (+) Transcript_19753:376-1638(+)